MRIAVVSDIHGNLPALEAVVMHYRRYGPDYVINLGDCLSGPLLSRETAQFLMEQDWVHLAGNHDHQILAYGTPQCTDVDEIAYEQLSEKQLAWLKTLPAVRLVWRTGILLCHGTPDDDLEYFLETVVPAGARMATRQEVEARLGTAQARLILCGHTHMPRAVRTTSGQLVLNPGSVGLPAYDDAIPYPHVIQTGSPDAHYALLEYLHGGWTASLVSVPYDYRPMVKLAQLRHFPDWAHALATGYVS